MPTFTTACPLDCPDTCSLEVEVSDGKLLAVRAGERNPWTQGFICSKVGRIGRYLEHADRILQPQVRAGRKGSAQFRRASWDEALDLVARRLLESRDRFGGESILPLFYGGSNGLLSQDTTDARLFYRLGASKLARTVCAAATGAASRGLYGSMGGVALHDYVHARLIVVWGANPSVTGIHLVPVVQAAQRAGAKLVVVDPRATPLAKRADLHLQLRPGTDLPAALSVIHWLFESGRADDAFLANHATGVEQLRQRAAGWTFERAAATCGVEAATLQRFAGLYADSQPAVIRCGWGLERNRNGGSAVASVLALPAVAGKFGVRGGGYTLSNSGAWTYSKRTAIGADPPPTRTVNMNRVGRILAADGEPTVRTLFVYNCNPLATLPKQELVRRGLQREDLFTVVFDQVLTDTARYADVVLPATTFLEHDDLRAGYGAYVTQRVDACIDPVGEARSNVEVFAELCRRTGLAEPGDAESATELRDQVLGVDAATLERAGVLHPASGESPVQFVDVWPRTGDRKAHLFPEALDREAPSGLYSYQEQEPGGHPLTLISPATARTISSSFGNLRRRPIPLEMHPDDAGARCLAKGDRVRVFNDDGEVHCHLAINADLRPGTCLLPKGMWSHQSLNGATANALAPDSFTDLGEGACFNDARVEVRGLQAPPRSGAGSSLLGPRAGATTHLG